VVHKKREFFQFLPCLPASGALCPSMASCFFLRQALPENYFLKNSNQNVSNPLFFCLFSTFKGASLIAVQQKVAQKMSNNGLYYPAVLSHNELILESLLQIWQKF
jgi:hypothetical protein